MGNQKCIYILLAAKLDSSEVCELLLRWGANPKIQGADDATPLLIATQWAHSAIVQILAAHPDGFAILDTPDSLGRTPLMHACANSEVDCVETLLRAQCAVDARDARGRTALLMACALGDSVLVRILLDARADIAGPNTGALRKACSGGFVACVKELLNANAPVGEMDDHGNTLLHSACIDNGGEVVRLLLASDAMSENICAHHNARGQNAVDVALLRGDDDGLAMALLIVHAHPSLLCVSEVDIHRLLDACPVLPTVGAAVLRRILTERGHWGQAQLTAVLYKAVQYRDIDCVRCLLAQNANVRDAFQVDAHTTTVLHSCASDGCYEILCLLLSECGVVETALASQDREGLTPLMCAARMGHMTCVVTLLLYGSAVDAMDNAGRTALYHAACFGWAKICKLLVRRYGAGVRYVLSDGTQRTILHAACLQGSRTVCALLLAHSAEPNALTSSNASPLLEATAGGHTRTCQLLLEARADCALADSDQVTPLMEAAYGGHEATVRALLHHGAPPCGAALDAAAYCGHVAVCEVLLAHKADVRRTDEFGWTPVFSATLQGHLPVLDVLAQGPVEWQHVDHYGLSASHIACVATNPQPLLEKLKAFSIEDKDKDEVSRAVPSMHRRHRGLAKKFEQFLQRKVASLGT